MAAIVPFPIPKGIPKGIPFPHWCGLAIWLALANRITANMVKQRIKMSLLSWLLLGNCNGHNIRSSVQSVDDERNLAKSAPSPHRHLGNCQTCERGHPGPPSLAWPAQIRNTTQLTHRLWKMINVSCFKPLSLWVICYKTKANRERKWSQN